jgi:hypothetical protein
VLLFALGLLAFVPARAVEVNSQEQAIFNLMKNASGQHRPFLVLDPILCKVARQKAADMANRGYFAHVDPDGHGANWLVRQAGYVLPAGYDESSSGNNIESLSAGRDTASWAWDDWMGSAPHKEHLLGEISFFAAQTSVGVGFVNVPGSEWQWYWVVISAPPTGPMLRIISPASGAEVTDAFVTVSGTTGGEPAAASVEVRVENAAGEGPWIAATGTTSWSATVDGLIPGANTLRVRTLKASGEMLRNVARSIRYVVLAPVTVTVSGSGSVTNGFAGTSQREVGRSYTVTATAKAGWLFAGWSGGITGLQKTVSFTMPEGGLDLAATFIPNPFLAGHGGYTGLFTTTDGTHGAVSVSLGASGAFTGRLRFDGESLTLKGRFDAAGAAQVTVTSTSGATYSLALTYANTDGAPHIFGTISGDGWTAELPLDALTKPSVTKNVNAGRYTLVLPAPGAPSATLPSGDGVATVRVSDTGTAAVAGTLADGTPFTARGRLTASGSLQVFVSPYARSGMLTGTLHFRAQQVSDLDGALFWSRPAHFAAAFADGFDMDITTVGSLYLAPTSGQSVVPVTDGTNNTALALGEGGLVAPVVQPATLARDNTLTIGTPAITGLTVRLSAITGIFAGTFIHPETGTPSKFRGVVLQKQGAGFGFFVGGSEAGYATFAPAEKQASLAAP